MNFLNTLTNDCSYIFPRLSRLREIFDFQVRENQIEQTSFNWEEINMSYKSYFFLLFYFFSLLSHWGWCDYWIWLLLPQCRHYLIKICHIHHHWLSSPRLPFTNHDPQPTSPPSSTRWLKTEWERERVLQNHKSFPDDEQKDPDHWWTAITREEGSELLIKKSGMRCILSHLETGHR